MSKLPPIDYGSIDRVTGPLIVVRGVEGVGYDEMAEIRLPDGTVRHGVVLEVDRDLAVVQVYEGTRGIGISGSSVRFTATPFVIPVGNAWMGRACNGRGDPIDGGPPIVGAESRAVIGTPVNPAHRAPPQDAIVTGISAIDGLTTLVRGQKLPSKTFSRLAPIAKSSR
jgi:V/A-type H+-transporting ATPase subunit B